MQITIRINRYQIIGCCCRDNRNLQLICHCCDRNVAAGEVRSYDSGYALFLYELLVSGDGVIRCAFSIQTNDLYLSAKDTAIFIDLLCGQLHAV